MGSEEFYGAGGGDALADPALYPPAVARFRESEDALLAAVARGADTLVEVGGMHGLHLEWAHARGLRYLGLDVVERYAADGRERIRQLGPDAARLEHRFVCGDATKLPAILEQAEVGFPSLRAVLLFPFNSIGNMADLEGVVRAITAVGLPLLISTYQVSAEATAIRRDYYLRSGLSIQRVVEDDQGVHFQLSGGHTISAYRDSHLRRLFRSHGVELAHRIYSELGVAYLREEDLDSSPGRSPGSPIG